MIDRSVPVASSSSRRLCNSDQPQVSRYCGCLFNAGQDGLLKVPVATAALATQRLPLPPLRVSHPHSAVPQSGAHRRWVDAELASDPSE